MTRGQDKDRSRSGEATIGEVTIQVFSDHGDVCCQGLYVPKHNVPEHLFARDAIGGRLKH
jgi:hypothetical protein